MNLHKFITDAISEKLAAMPALAGADLSAVSVEVPKVRDFGDFSTNTAMVLARPLKQNPRAIADLILPEISALPFVESASVAGPGFVNIRLKDEFIMHMSSRHTANTEPPEVDGESSPLPGPFQIPGSASRPRNAPLTFDLDYGAYNVAKSLHIGHLRTGIVGDTFNRIAKYLGYKTVSYNHIGDWGRPMGLVIAWIESLHPEWPFFQADFNAEKINQDDYKISAAELDTYYPAASARAKSDEAFLDKARKITADFQNGHPGYTALYDIFLKISLNSMDLVIHRQNLMPFDKMLGERNAALYVPTIEKMLRERNLLISDDGAEIVAVKKDSDKAPMPPLMFKNSRNADTYAARDLAALYYRKITDNPDKVIYFTDARQTLHFQQVFRVAEMLGLFDSRQIEHIWFGTINGPDGGPYKTRDGNAAGLLDIMQTVSNAAKARIAESGKNLPDETVEMIALAALKFNDLMHDVKSDYVFDPDAVTQFEGRTGPYILYTAVRLNSVLKKAVSFRGSQSENPESGKDQGVGSIPSKEMISSQEPHHIPDNFASQNFRDDMLFEPDERNLLLTLLDFNRTVSAAFDKRATDLLANYTYDLCQSINTFYHNCPILRDDVDGATRAHRLAIVRNALSVLSTAIDLMGLKIPEEM